MNPRLSQKKKEQKDPIKWRSHEVTRIEALSDAVFAFAITLMVVSLEVPKTFNELKELLYGFFPFAICFMLFFQVWGAQNLFFRRYNMHDEMTLVLNGVLLFVMLFFVYPMKFMWSAIFRFQTAFAEEGQQVQLFCIYSVGFSAIYLLFAAMYANAYRRREQLNLTATEAFETVTYFYRNLGIALVGITSMIVASFGPNYIPFAGCSYSLIAVVIGLTHGRRKKLHLKKYGRDLYHSDETHLPIMEESVNN